MISPNTIAPTSDPTTAPTIPPQNRSGRKIVKCQIAKPIITQPSIPISASPPRSPATSNSSARPAVAAVAGPAALLALLRLVLEHEILGCEIGRGIALLDDLLLGLGDRSPLRHA